VSGPLRSEADAVRTLDEGTWTMDEIYAWCSRNADISRAGGHDPVPGHAGDFRWKRRVRCALQDSKRRGGVHQVRRAVWAVHGTRERPVRLVLIVAGGTLLDFELRVCDAVDLLMSLDAPADLVFTDAPWALGRGDGRFADGNGYRRDHSRIVPGYVDVDPADYPEFTRRWVNAAAAVLRPGGQLAVVTGAQQAALVQVTAEQAGLTFVSSIPARKEFPLYTERRPAFAHYQVTVLCRGRIDSPARVYHPPLDQPRAASGRDYPLDWWVNNGRADRPGLYRYDNALPLRMCRRVLHCFSDPGGHVVDPHLGSGTSAVAAYLDGRRYTGGDINPHAVRFAAARLLAEHAWLDDAQPGLYPSPVARLAEQAGGLW
jgi:DNA modification methylase